jgi:dTDP-4-amino-4,6-dideoxygalactose transaminase
MKIEFIRNSYRRFYKAHKREILSSITKCISNGDFILSNEVKKFEKKLADYVGVKYAVGVNSGTDALFLSLKALGIGDGDECIVPSHTFIATIQVIVHCGATPIFIDVNRDGLMDCDKLEELITQKTRAIIPVHLSGKIVDMDKIRDIVSRHNQSNYGKKIYIVEDSCQALGSVQGRCMAGSFGATGCFSFISPKSLGGISDGGAVVTDNKEIYEKLLLLRNHWNITQNALMGHQPKQPEIMGWGWNSRLGNVTASYLNVKFKYYDSMLKKRKKVAEMYNKGITNEKIEKPIQYEGQIYSEYIVNVDNPVKFKEYMASKGVETLIRDLVPNHKLKGLGLENFDLPITEELAKVQARLPIYPELYDKEVKYIIKCVNEYV